jgi:hypothetical protein
MRRNLLAALLSGAAALAATAARAADDVPEPRLDRVDYAHPEKYLGLPETLGAKEAIAKIAAGIRGATPRERLAGIGEWIDAHLAYDAKAFDRWRDVPKIAADGTYGGCADHAEVFGTLSRACGIPTVWVKSLDLDWIAWFRLHPDEPKSWNGHVFVEVHLDGGWRLYDAVRKTLYEDYDVRQRILPGHRLAYDKGGDPYELLLSTRWEEWKKQTRKFVASLDMSLVPVGEPRQPDIVDPPGRVYVAATHPAWQWVVDRLTVLHLPLGSLSGNGGWERWLPAARRGILVVPAAAGTTVLPERYWPLLPVQPDRMGEALGGKPSAVVRKKAADGTDVVLVLAKDDDALKTAIALLDIDVPPETKPSAGAPPARPTEDAKEAPPGPPGTVYVAADSPDCYWVADRCKELGYKVGMTGNCAFEKWVPSARSGILVVVSVGGTTVLTGKYAALVPADADTVRETLRTKESDVVRRKAADGTDVVLLMARDKDALKAAIAKLTLDAPK